MKLITSDFMPMCYVNNVRFIYIIPFMQMELQNK